MPHLAVTEEPLQFGENGRLFGILTLPDTPVRNMGARCVVVLLSAGLMHRVGPHRLHVDLARVLAQIGFTSLRVDLAGRGDSASQVAFTSHEALKADFAEIVSFLDSRFGRSPIVLAGMCSGADNAVMLAADESRVVGMVLLDPMCFPDKGLWGYRTRHIIAYISVTRLIAWSKRRLKAITRPADNSQQRRVTSNPDALWDPPTREQMQAAFNRVRERRGRVLSIFTGVSRNYNQIGQLGRVLGVPGYREFCTELFWPQSDHTFSLELYRRQLIESIKNWASDSFTPEIRTLDLRVLPTTDLQVADSRAQSVREQNA